VREGYGAAMIPHFHARLRSTTRVPPAPACGTCGRAFASASDTCAHCGVPAPGFGAGAAPAAAPDRERRVGGVVTALGWLIFAIVGLLARSPCRR
jgi:hypothetical protein